MAIFCIPVLLKNVLHNAILMAVFVNAVSNDILQVHFLSGHIFSENWSCAVFLKHM